MIGDRDAVSVPREIVQDVLGSAEGRLRVDDPVVAKEGAEQGAQRRWSSASRLEVARKHRAVPATKGVLSDRRQTSAKHATQDLHREEERIARMDPPRAGRARGRPTGIDAVDVRVVQQILSPRVEHAEKADRGTEMLRRAGDLEERGGTRLEEQVVDDPFILQGQPRELVREREDDVVVPDREEFRPVARRATGRARASGTSGSAGCGTS